MQDQKHSRRARFGLRMALPAAAFLAAVTAAPSNALDTTTLTANYVISIGGVVVGHVQARSKFTDGGYVAAITGSTGGVSRLVSDATAKLEGTGRIAGSRVLPATYTLETKERGFNTHVAMEMQGGKITDLVAMPRLTKTPDRVPLTAGHTINIVDPLGAFIVPLDRPGIPSGRRVCDRTIPVFDGWTRFDVKLYYKETKAVDGSANMYAGRVIVCGARYVPVAGHRSTRGPIKELADNQRLEVWLAPVKDMRVLVPYRLLIGTALGDMMIYATKFATGGEQRAEAN